MKSKESSRFLNYLKLIQEKSGLISKFPLIGFQKDLCCNWLDRQQVFFISYNSKPASE